MKKQKMPSTNEPVAVTVPSPGPSIARDVFVSLCTRPAGGRSTAVTSGASRGGGLPFSLSSIAHAAGSALQPLLPSRMSGLNVSEALHRLDANAHLPTLDRGVTSANRVGEALGTISMRWLLTPDDFEATPSATPPAIDMDSARSQRFVMRDGALTFTDRGEGTIRFFGAGRTYPATVGNQPRLFFAGTGTVLDSAGSLKGTRGTLAITGEISPAGGIALSVLGHFDADGPLSIEDALGPLLDAADADPAAVVFTLTGTASNSGPEQLNVLRVGNDLPNATRLRSLARVGSRIGRAVGRMPVHSTDHRYAVPLAAVERELVFTDPAGRRIGSVTVDTIEGTSFREERGGEMIDRTVAYGCIGGGTGALAGAAGVVTIDAALPESGGRDAIYSVRLGDSDGRFHAPFDDVYRPMPAVGAGTPPPLPPDTLVFVDASAAQITDVDRTILRYAERALADGMELARWWEAKDRVGDYAERFDLIRENNASDRSFGFFDAAVIAGSSLPVMGIVQEMFYDRQKLSTGETIRAQLQEFVLRYFMRVSHYRQPEAIPAGKRASSSFFQRAVSWLPEEEERRVGFRYRQLYYKQRESGRIGKFGREEQNAIVDLRQIGPVYDWIVLKVDIFDFNLSFAPFGGSAPKLQLPLKESTYLVLGPPFVKNVENPEPGVLGQYGFDYAFVPYAPEPGVIAYGPGYFAAAIQTVDFTLMKDGEIRVRVAFVVNRPTKILNIDVAPLDWGFQMADMMTFNMASRVMAPVKAVAQRLPLRITGVDPVAAYIWLANTMTGGMAERQFGISKTVLEKRMLVQHFMQLHEMLINSLLAWRTVPDWTDTDRLPDYCRTGITV
ncbi:MAG TPA: hypothetical protein VH138_11445 [Vicinamibacterales bacterium]|nr:hypothetical protein [Vicinamibacterales bacterium]